MATRPPVSSWPMVAPASPVPAPSSPDPDDGPSGRTVPEQIEAKGRHRRDQVAAFRPAILGIRIGTTAVSVALSASAVGDTNRAVMLWCAALVAYNVFRVIRPLRVYDDTSSLLRIIGEVAIHVLAVVATGYWDSPLVFSLLTAIMVAGFARGFGVRGAHRCGLGARGVDPRSRPARATASTTCARASSGRASSCSSRSSPGTPAGSPARPTGSTRSPSTGWAGCPTPTRCCSRSTGSPRASRPRST